MELTGDNVKKLLEECLRENSDQEKIEVDGIVIKVYFNKAKIMEHKEDIKDMLLQLPDDFMKSKGGGMSFINMCIDKEGRQWTDFHQTQDMLFCLGKAIGMADFCIADKEIWKVMPGGMPYIFIDDTK